VIEQILSRVPEYRTFLTVDELNESSLRLASEHSAIVRATVVGRSTDGEEIQMLRIGNGDEQLLFFACPHPNEPIGAMTLEALSEQLVENPELRGERYTWNLIKCIDPDSTRLNEGWFKGPFTITHYAREFYRPTSFDQAEWTFPIVYKKYGFFRPIPETQALMTAITGLRPTFIYSLHNAGMGGGYYYLHPHRPEIDDALRALMTDRGIPLSLGEPEMPWGVELSPAIYQSTTLVEHYDFLEKFGQGDPCARMQGGEGSFGFARGISDPAHIVCELPYFYDERVGDTSPTDTSRKDAILQGIERVREMTGFTSELYARIGQQLTVASRFRTASEHLTKLIVDGLEAKRAWAETSPELDVPATVAQRFDNLVVGRFYNLLIVGMLRRTLALENEQASTPEIDAALAEVEERFAGWAAQLEEEIDYRVIPIKTLVEIQLGAALRYIDTL
jgi:hypothetical protein